MTQALGIGASAIGADMTAIDALAENIANAQTPGYVSESANLSPLPGGAGDGVGAGVEVTSITQATNALLSANNWQAQGALSNLSALQETLTAMENVFPLPTQSASSTSATASSSISGLLSNFWSAWDAVGQSPSSNAPRAEVVDDAKGLVTALHEAATELSQITQNAVAELTDQVTQVNSLLTQVATLNKSITTVGSGAAADSLGDQLRAVLDTLSQLAGVDVHMQSNGTARVSIGGTSVVQGTTASTLELVDTGSGSYSVKIAGTSGGATVSVSSGSMAGLLSAVNTYLPSVRNNLNTVAKALATKVNTTLQAAYRSTGAPATATTTVAATTKYWQMFSEATGAGTVSASGIEVNTTMIADPSLIAVSATSGGAAANNGVIAQRIAELGTTKNGPDAKYQTLIENIGASTLSVNDQLQAQTSVATQASQALQSVSGVNVTDELTALLSFQQNYEASAKVLDTVDSTVQALLQAV
ncbi:MAG: flagellar hook-associated protein FlgK [Acidimicrobiales bacterium]